MDAPLCKCGCGAPVGREWGGKGRGWNAYVVGHNPGPWKPERYAVDEATGCWVWALSLRPDGYGQVRDNGTTRRAHVVEWERVNGPVPDGLQLDHLCRNRACVNPEHLEPVTHAENGRRGAGTKLKVGQVREMKRLLREGASCVDIARRFGVAPQTVTAIKTERNWVGV